MKPADWLRPLKDPALAFTAHDAGPADGIIFRPLYEVHHEHHSVYWRLRGDSTSANLEKTSNTN